MKNQSTPTKDRSKDSKLTQAEKLEAARVTKKLNNHIKATAAVKAKLDTIKAANEVILKNLRKQVKAEQKAAQAARAELLNKSTRYSAGIARPLNSIVISPISLNEHKENLCCMFQSFIESGRGDLNILSSTTTTFVSISAILDGLQTGYIEAAPVTIKRA